MKETNPSLVDGHTNSLLTNTPSTEEIKCVMLILNKESALGLDGFGDFFFHTYYDIIKDGVIKVVP